MSTEVTPESLRAHAKWVRDDALTCDNTWAALEATNLLLAKADRLEREQHPLPTEPGWYPNIVVERGGESCTGAFLRDDAMWVTAHSVGDSYHHYAGDSMPTATIRWAEQDGKTPGQTLYEATDPQLGKWSANTSGFRGRFEQRAAAVLAAHGTPDAPDARPGPLQELSQTGWPVGNRATPTLTPVGEHPKPGTRGLLPVVVASRTGAEWRTHGGACICGVGARMAHAILADPRPDGAQ